MKKFIAAALSVVFIVLITGCANPPTRGVIADGVYSNTYFDLSFKLPDGWQALSDDEFLQKYSQARATNEELAKTKMGFGDALFYKTEDKNSRMNLWYDSTYGKGTTDEQIKNRLLADTPDYQFGEIKSFKIGEADYSMMSAPTADATYNLYYCWSNELTGYLRPMMFVVLAADQSIDDILVNFSQIVE